MKQADVRAWFVRRGWKAIAGGRSGLLHATTGAGKTYAGWLGALMVFRALAQAPRAREAIKNIADNENRKTAPLTVLVTTPESLSLLLSRADAKETLASVRMVVVDEWHELIGKRSAVLRWNGGRWPLSSILADAVVEQFGLAHVGRYDTPEPQSMRPLLDIQQRRFREIARVSELIFQGYPGEKRSNKQQATSNKQLQASSSLFYGVFRKYDPTNRLLQAALARMNNQRLRLQILAQPTPFSFPLMVDRFREQLSSPSRPSRRERPPRPATGRRPGL